MNAMTEQDYARAMSEQAAKDHRAQVKAGNMGFGFLTSSRGKNGKDTTGESTPSIIAAMRGKGWLSTREIAEAAGTSVAQTQRILPRLIMDGKAENENHKRPTPRGLVKVRCYRVIA